MSSPALEHPFAADRLDDVHDFAAGLDVAGAGRAAAARIAAAIAAVRQQPEHTSSRKVLVLRGPAGYGKTHILGRVLHANRDAHLAYVQMVSATAKERVVEHIQHGVVESLFRARPGSIRPLSRLLARVFAPSFQAYFEHLPAAWKAKPTVVRMAKELADEPMSMLELLNGAGGSLPYLRLAGSWHESLPQLSQDVLEALVLGLSPNAAAARSWLRGDADTLSKDCLVDLQLPPESPPVEEVLRGIAGGLRPLGTPLIVCLDQLERLVGGNAEMLHDLAAALMGWLAIPNALYVLGMTDDTWRKLSEGSAFESLRQRCEVVAFDYLNVAEAQELVVRRMRQWAGGTPNQPDGHPIDLLALNRYVEAERPGPRVLLQQCRVAFDDWIAKGRVGLADRFGDDGPDPDPFLAEWQMRRTAAEQAGRSAGDCSDAELWDLVVEAVRFAQEAGLAPAGWRIATFAEHAAGAGRHSSMRLEAVRGAERKSLALAASAKIGGAGFAGFVKALEPLLKGTAGAVVVWPTGKLTVGATADSFKKYRKWLDAGTLRAFPLDEHPETFHALLALAELVKDAESDGVKLNGARIDPARARQLLADSKAIAGLKFFEFLLANWKGFGEPAPVAPAASAPPPLPPPSIPAALPAAPIPAVESKPALVPEPVVEPKPAADDGVAQWAAEKLAHAIEQLRKRGQSVLAFETGCDIGPGFVRLKLAPQGSADYDRIRKQAANLKLHLGLERTPLVSAEAGYVAVDIARPQPRTVPLAEALAAGPPPDGRAAFPAGVDVAGKTHWIDLAEPATCHLLVAGATGSGKSEFLKALIGGLAARLPPSELEFRLIDPKRVTFNFGPSPYLPKPVVHDAAAALPALEECCREMERRYRLLQERHVENIAGLRGPDAVPRWVVVFDEFADLVAEKADKKELEDQLKRLGAKARAAGIHLVLGTQRPEASVVTPLLRTNLPGRVALMVASERDSKILLASGAAAHLLGRGDLLLQRGGGAVRLQSPFVGKEELDRRLRIG